MKKVLLSGFIIVSFIIYSLEQKGKAGSISSQSSGGVLGIGSSGTTPTISNTSFSYKDGVYTGNVTDAYYGNVQVQVTIKGSKITNVQFLDYPQDRRTSIEINSQATPYLKSEAISAQSANVDIVSGATATSEAFISSLSSALSQAKN